MKQGMIVYIAGSEDLAEDFDPDQALQTLECHADQIGLVSAKAGFFDVHEALYTLISQGCGRISLLVAQAEGRDRLRCVKPPVRLFG